MYLLAINILYKQQYCVDIFYYKTIKLPNLNWGPKGVLLLRLQVGLIHLQAYTLAKKIIMNDATHGFCQQTTAEPDKDRSNVTRVRATNQPGQR